MIFLDNKVTPPGCQGPGPGPRIYDVRHLRADDCTCQHPEIVACIYCLFFFIFKSPCYNCGFKEFIPKFVMASNPVMELDIWKGEWGLPSIDVNCLEVMVRDRRN